MKNYFSLFVIIIFSSCSPKVYNQLSWQKAEVTADGNLREWSNPLRFFDPKSKLNYSISNDKKNLYICIKAGDDASQLKILRAGMEIKIDTSGKNTFPITLSYPVPDGEMVRRRRQKGENSDEQGDISRKQHLADGFKELKLHGFSIPDNSIAASDNSFGIKAGIDVDKNDFLVYELILPFKVFYKNELQAADSNKVFSYQIKVNGITFAKSDPDKSAGARNDGNDGSRGGTFNGGRSGGGGGIGGGGTGGGGMRGGGGGMRGGGGGMRGGGGGAGAPADPLSSPDIINFKAKFSLMP